jgi:hypothetical protein
LHTAALLSANEGSPLSSLTPQLAHFYSRTQLLTRGGKEDWGQVGFNVESHDSTTKAAILLKKGIAKHKFLVDYGPVQLWKEVYSSRMSERPLQVFRNEVYEILRSVPSFNRDTFVKSIEAQFSVNFAKDELSVVHDYYYIRVDTEGSDVDKTVLLRRLLERSRALGELILRKNNKLTLSEINPGTLLQISSHPREQYLAYVKMELQERLGISLSVEQIDAVSEVYQAANIIDPPHVIEKRYLIEYERNSASGDIENQGADNLTWNHAALLAGKGDIHRTLEMAGVGEQNATQNLIALINNIEKASQKLDPRIALKRTGDNFLLSGVSLGWDEFNSRKLLKELQHNEVSRVRLVFPSNRISESELSHLLGRGQEILKTVKKRLRKKRFRQGHSENFLLGLYLDVDPTSHKVIAKFLFPASYMPFPTSLFLTSLEESMQETFTGDSSLSNWNFHAEPF